jgi:hypothetical protein
MNRIICLEEGTYTMDLFDSNFDFALKTQLE